MDRPKGNPLVQSTLQFKSPAVRNIKSRYGARFTTRPISSLATTSSRPMPAAQELDEKDSAFKTPLPQPRLKPISPAVGHSPLAVHHQSPSKVSLHELSLAEASSSPEKAKHTLVEEFLKCLRAYPTLNEIFDLCESYDDRASQELIRIIMDSKSSKATSLSRQEISARKASEALIRQERNSWRITHLLIRDRTLIEENQEMDQADGQTPATGSLAVGLSDGKVIESCMEQNHLLRQMQLVVDWCEQNASNDYDLRGDDKLHLFPAECSSKENTLHELKSNRLNGRINSSRSSDSKICPYLDPDGPSRSGLPLVSIDDQDEQRLYKLLFSLARAGNLHKGLSLAEQIGQHWLSAALEGWKPFHDPNYEKDARDTELLPLAGNKFKNVWKKVAWKMAKLPSQSPAKKALFGIFSGNLQAVINCCPTYEDKLWAHFRCALDVHIEKVLKSHRSTTSSRSYNPFQAVSSSSSSGSDLPAEFWRNDLLPDTIFEAIDKLRSEPVLPEEKIHHLIQKYIILGDMPGLMRFMEQLVEGLTGRSAAAPELTPASESSKAELLRFFAHLTLFLRTIGQISDEDDHRAICIAVAYVDWLIQQRKIEHVAAYASLLPHQCQIACYAQLLSTIDSLNERRECIKFAQAAGLDIPAITLATVELAKTRPMSPEPQAGPGLGEDPFEELKKGEVSEEDSRMISSLDWLLYRDAITKPQYAEALVEGCSLIRLFLLSGRIESARKAFYRLPVDIIQAAADQWKQRSGKSVLPPLTTLAAREYSGYAAYFRVLTSFQEWHKYYTEAVPDQPAPAPRTSRFMDKLAHERHLADYSSARREYEANLKQLARQISDLSMAVLEGFNPEGWLCDTRAVLSELSSLSVSLSEERAHQLSTLRRTFLPKLIILLHTVLVKSDLHETALRLAEIISRGLIEVIPPSDLQFLMSLFEDTARHYHAAATLNSSSGPEADVLSPPPS